MAQRSHKMGRAGCSKQKDKTKFRARLERLETELKSFTEQNEYYYKMLELIQRNWPAGTKVISGRELHHICPRFYWKYTEQEVCNEDWNLVSLEPFDHLLCHYYLYECIHDNLKSKARNSLRIICKYTNKLLQPCLDEEFIESLKDAVDTSRAKHDNNTGKHWYHKVYEDGAWINVCAFECPEGFVAGRYKGDPDKIYYKMHRRESIHWKGFTHKKRFQERLQKVVFCKDAVDFYMEEIYPYCNVSPGQVIDWISSIEMFLDFPDVTITKILELFELLQKATDLGLHKRICPYTNGVDNIYLSKSEVYFGDIPKGYYPGRKDKAHKQTSETRKKISEARKGSTWWTNGVATKYCKECPGDGWKKGKVNHNKEEDK